MRCGRRGKHSGDGVHLFWLLFVVLTDKIVSEGLGFSQAPPFKGKIALFSKKARYFGGISLKQSYRNRMRVNLQAPLDLS